MPFLVIEADRDGGPHWKPGYYRSNVQRRIWWAWFAVSWTKGSYYQNHLRVASGIREWEGS